MRALLNNIPHNFEGVLLVIIFALFMYCRNEKRRNPNLTFSKKENIIGTIFIIPLFVVLFAQIGILSDKLNLELSKPIYYIRSFMIFATAYILLYFRKLIEYKTNK